MEFKTLVNPKVCSSAVVQVSTAVIDGCTPDDLRITAQDREKLPSGLLRAPLKRQQQFLASEFCIQEAMRHMLEQQPRIDSSGCDCLPLDRRIWCTTKTQSFASAAVSLKPSIRFLGIDSECIFPEEATSRLWNLILSKREIAFYEWHAKSLIDRCQFISLVFSAKQSIFKAANQMHLRQMKHQDLTIKPLLDGSKQFQFTCHRGYLNRLFGGTSVRGRYDFCYQHVHTAIEI